jgi:hypothetical protein
MIPIEIPYFVERRVRLGESTLADGLSSGGQPAVDAASARLLFKPCPTVYRNQGTLNSSGPELEVLHA